MRFLAQKARYIKPLELLGDWKKAATVCRIQALKRVAKEPSRRRGDL